jgi:hypothetical protein
MVSVKINGAEVSGKVEVTGYVHDMFAEKESDRVRVTLSDPSGLLDAWAVAPGMELSADCEGASTGVMWIAEVRPHADGAELVARSAPAPCFVPRRKAWEGVGLHRMVKEIALECGLEPEMHGVEDNAYGYVMQDGEGNLEFLSWLLAFEGCACIVHDRKLVVYDEAYMEGFAPLLYLDVTGSDDYEYIDETDFFVNRLTTGAGKFTGVATVEDADGYDVTWFTGCPASSDAEAYRFAAGMLRGHNKGLMRGHVRTGFMPGAYPGGVAELKNEMNKRWDGPVFVTRVRHEGDAEGTKIFFRRIPEGY